MNKILKEYAELKIQEKKIQDRIKDLKADVTNIVFDEDNQKLETQWGRFELRDGRKQWKYSDALTDKEEQVKEAFKIKKREEELKGIAMLEKAPTNLVFTVNKGQENPMFKETREALDQLTIKGGK